MKVMLVKDRNVSQTKWVQNFAKELVLKGYTVELVCNSIFEPPSTISPHGFTFVNLGKKLFHHILPSPLVFKRYINSSKPDIIICYFPKDLYNVALLGKPKAPIIMMMHNPPNEVFDKLQSNFFKKKLYAYLMNKVSILQVLMSNFKPLAEQYYHFPKIEIIPNQVSQIPPDNRRNLNNENKLITHIAQIAEKYKRQHLTLEAFSKIHHLFPDWHLEFYGKVKKGKHQKYYKHLLQRMEDLGLTDKVHFKGYCKNIEEVYQKADINCTPSFSEGFGYGMADGLAYGVVGLGFKDALGVNELIKDGVTGFLVTDVDDYASKMKVLMENKDLRIKMGEVASADMQRYSPDIVIKKWDKLIQETVS